MGLVCRSEIFDMVPALVESIKVAGLVLVADMTGAAADAGDSRKGSGSAGARNTGFGAGGGVLEGVDGVVVGRGGVVRFSEGVDM